MAARRRLEATDDTLTFVRVLTDLWHERPRHGATVLKVGVTLTRVSEDLGQSLDLFDESRDRGRLNATVDVLNRRFGKQAVYVGTGTVRWRPRPCGSPFCVFRIP